MTEGPAATTEHLSVKPSRETVRLAQHQALMPQVMSIFAAVGGTQADYDALLDTLADAVLDLLPGRSEAEVKAEALQEFADAHRFPSDWIMFRRDDGAGVTVSDMLREAAAHHTADHEEGRTE